jgi:hypothetical protein
MENLRVWDDDETGGILCMIHFSAIFRKGYMTFYLNNALQPIKVKDEGAKIVKIKGLKISLDQQMGRRNSEKPKYVTGARIDFINDLEKAKFIQQVREAQLHMVDIEKR